MVVSRGFCIGEVVRCSEDREWVLQQASEQDLWI